MDAVRARNLKHALREMSGTPDVRPTPIAGGTDLYVYLNAGTLEPRRFLDLWGVRELRGVRVGRDGITFGALATFREIREHPAVRRRLPSLAAAAAEVGAWQIQNRATIAGNVANASPAGDSLPVLLAHDAVVRVRSVRGERAIPFADLYRGYRALALDPDELIVALHVPFSPPRAAAFFRKVGTRRAQSISKVVFAGVLAAGRDAAITHARLAFGSVAPVPLRARIAEEALLRGRPSAKLREHALDALEADLTPIDDIRSTREYRLQVARNVLAQFLRAAHPGFARD
jgi:CO/xanthine dehydrogenase FAD-binding subunit